MENGSRAVKKHFTLIELMVVIGMAALLMGLAIPAYNKIMKSTSVDREAALFKLAIEQAQAKAVTSRRDVALIIPNGAKNKFCGSTNSLNDTPQFNNNTYSKYYLGSARMAYVQKNSGGGWDFVRWVPDSKWLEPMQGVKIILVTDNYDDLPEKVDDEFKTGKFVDTVTGTDLYRGSNSGAFVTISGIEGNPTVESGIIFSPYGNLRSRKDLYIALAECDLSGDNLVYPKDSTGSSRPANFLVLDINRVNGKVSYHAYKE